MTAYDRQSDWIFKWLLQHNGATDVTDVAFQEAFAKEFNASFIEKMYGAQPCPLAQRVLRRMWDDYRLRRSIIGLPEMSGMGFPKWVYSYSLPR